MKLKYGDKIIEMQGIIVQVEDGAVGIDLKGRLGYLKIPLRMLITDYPLQLGQEVGFRMSFPEVLSLQTNEKYVSNIDKKKRKEGNL
ncbi:CBO2463/CBO2479 domain-containing protein [Clostridium sp. Mt-5]|uniref:CBO2463/CBO2479 domain-containing protein n=1 Tax=Clostridium moutaii TaxID=3240932 RepID=A0ABV4BKP7_9CLOT